MRIKFAMMALKDWRLSRNDHLFYKTGQIVTLKSMDLEFINS
jgi:hypothetical protein